MARTSLRRREYERLADGDPSSESDDVTFCPYDAGGDETTGVVTATLNVFPAPGIGIGVWVRIGLST